MREKIDRIFGSVPALLGVVLITAALLKVQQLATQELDEKGILTSRLFATMGVLFELGFGLWLIGGLYPAFTRYLGLLTFGGFFEFAIYQAAFGEPTCRCLGAIPVKPWYTA